jgi:hypothetical protein
MPGPMLKKITDVCGIPEDRVEHLWDKAKGLVKEQYSDVEAESGKFYELTVGILRTMIGKECVEKLGWKTKAEQLVAVMEDYGTWDYYSMLSDQPYVSIETLKQALETLEKAWLAKDEAFFYNLLRGHFEKCIAQEQLRHTILIDVKTRILEVANLLDMRVTTERATILDDLLRRTYDRFEQSMNDGD